MLFCLGFYASEDASHQYLLSVLDKLFILFLPVSEAKLERLRMAMKPLVEAEKQLRASNDRATWLTAALLQLGSHHHINSHKIFPASCEGTSVTQSSVALDDGVGEDFEHRSSSGRQPWVEENETNMDRPPNENQESIHVKSSKNTCNERSVKDFPARESRGKVQVELRISTMDHYKVQRSCLVFKVAMDRKSDLIALLMGIIMQS